MTHRKIWRIAFLLCLMFMPFACGKEYPFATESDCDDCYTEKPEYGAFHINLDDQKSDSAIIVSMYEGKYTEAMRNDDSHLVFRDTIKNESSIDVDVPLNKYYSVVAEYQVNGAKYRVIDGDGIKVYSINSTCDFDCWIIRGGKANCKLKF
jgi:hypothetical protein